MSYPTKFTTWLSGNAAQPEHPPLWSRYMAGSSQFKGGDLSENWFHFALTTPTSIEDHQTRIRRFFVQYRMKFCSVIAVHVWSGPERKLIADVTQPAGSIRNTQDIDRNNLDEGTTLFTLGAIATGHSYNYADPIQVTRGISISVKVRFDSRESRQVNGEFVEVNRNLGMIEFYSVGADWEVI